MADIANMEIGVDLDTTSYLRDELAIEAMKALIAANKGAKPEYFELLAKDSYQLADAMLAARKAGAA